MTTNRTGPPEREEPGATRDAGPNRESPGTTHTDQPQGNAWGRQCVVSSQQVDWWAVHEHVEPLLASVGSWPMVGTPQWCDLPDDDPVKRAAILDAAQHWALRVETCQQALAEASKDVAAVVNWFAIGAKMRQRRLSAYIKRVVA